MYCEDNEKGINNITFVESDMGETRILGNAKITSFWHEKYAIRINTPKNGNHHNKNNTIMTVCD